MAATLGLIRVILFQRGSKGLEVIEGDLAWIDHSKDH